MKQKPQLFDFEEPKRRTKERPELFEGLGPSVGRDKAGRSRVYASPPSQQ